MDENDTGTGAEAGAEGVVDEAAAIAGADSSEFRHPGYEPGTEDLGVKAADEVPTEIKTDEAGADAGKGAEAGKKADEGTQTDEEKAAADEEQRVQNELLGIVTGEPETVETLNAKYGEIYRQHEAAQAEFKAKALALAETGLEFIQKSDGTFALAASPTFKESFDPASVKVDANRLYDSLTQTEKDLIATDERAAVAMIAGKIAKDVAAGVISQRPVPTATRDDAILPGQEQERVANAFVNAKLSDGKTERYPDAAGKVMQTMSQIFNAPGKVAEDFRRIANRSPEHLHYAMDLLYAKVFRANAGSRAILQDRAAQAKLNADKNKNKPSGGGSGISGSAATGRSGNESEAESIARAQ